MIKMITKRRFQCNGTCTDLVEDEEGTLTGEVRKIPCIGNSKHISLYPIVHEKRGTLKLYYKCAWCGKEYTEEQVRKIMLGRGDCSIAHYEEVWDNGAIIFQVRPGRKPKRRIKKMCMSEKSFNELYGGDFNDTPRD
jgi:hypothetical protein